MEKFQSIELSKTSPFPVTFKLDIEGESRTVLVNTSYDKSRVSIDPNDDWEISATVEVNGHTYTTAGYTGRGSASICAQVEGSPNETWFLKLRIGHYQESQEWINYPVPGRMYRHYKGGIYVVLHLAQDTETQKTVVVYRSVPQDLPMENFCYTRPLEQWFEKTEGSDQETRFKES